MEGELIIKKVTAIFVACCLLFSCTSIYAYTDSGTKLLNWYHSSFQKSKEKVTIILLDGIDNLRESVFSQTEESFIEMKDRLSQFLLNSTIQSKSEMENYKGSYQTQLVETKELLKDTDFKEFTIEKEKEINTEISRDIESFLEELLSNEDVKQIK